MAAKGKKSLHDEEKQDWVDFLHGARKSRKEKEGLLMD